MGLTGYLHRLLILSLFGIHIPQTIVSAGPARVIVDHQLISLCGLVQFSRNLVIVCGGDMQLFSLTGVFS